MDGIYGFLKTCLQTLDRNRPDELAHGGSNKEALPFNLHGAWTLSPGAVTHIFSPRPIRLMSQINEFMALRTGVQVPDLFSCLKMYALGINPGGKKHSIPI